MSSANSSARRRKSPNIHLIIRRIHLYSGLFLLPWVLIYGVSAFLFNHPRFFTNTTVQSLPQPKGLEAFRDPNQLADQILLRIAAQKNIAPAQLIRQGEASYPYNAHIRTYGETMNGRFYFELDGKETVLEKRPGSQKPEAAPLDGAYPLPAGNLSDQAVTEAITPFLQDLESTPYRKRVRWVPPLEFQFAYDNAIWKAEYDLQDGQLKAKRLEDIKGPGWRRTLLDLHKTHVYEGSMAQIFWVIIVDIMAFAMVIWGLSGAYMWWKMKKTRHIGKVLLISAFTIAAVMVYAMYIYEFS